MALIVEDGTGKPDAESYISAADALAYLTSIGLTWSATTTDAQEQCLRRATNYMLQAYRDRWTGFRVIVNPMQALDWPRYGVEVDHFPVHFDIVPLDIQHACAELAYKAATEELNADLDQAVVTKGIGPLRKEYDRYSPQWKRFRSIDMRLAPYLTRLGMNGTVVRA